MWKQLFHAHKPFAVHYLPSCFWVIGNAMMMIGRKYGALTGIQPEINCKVANTLLHLSPRFPSSPRKLSKSRPNMELCILHAKHNQIYFECLKIKKNCLNA